MSRLEIDYFDLSSITEPQIVTISDDQLQVEFPSNWMDGRCYSWLVGRFAAWEYWGRSVRIRISDAYDC